MSLPARHTCQLLIGAFIAAVLLATAASAQDPPPAEPGLAAMAIGVQDLPRGATVIGEGDTRYSGAESAYERMFTLGRRAARAAGFASLESTVALYGDASTAASQFATIRQGFASAQGRRILARSIARELGLPMRRVKVGSARSLHVGDESFALPIRVRFVGVTVRAVLAVARVDRAIAQVQTAGVSSPAALKRRTTAMLDTSAQHIRVGLPAAAASRRQL